MLFGAHVSSGGGLGRAPERAAELGCEAFQIFTQNSRTWRPTQHADEDVEAFRAHAPAVGPAVAHAIYIINLATDDPVVYGKSVDALAETARNAQRLGLAGVVVHVGSHKGRGLDATMPQIVTGIQPALAELGDEAWLLLENSAGAGDTIGRDVSDLARVIAAIDHPRLGLCLDTCHLFVSGVDIREQALADALLEEVDREIGLERLRCLHVNDSAAPLGSNRDRHANIGTGELGERIGVLLAHPRLQGLPAILETAGPEGKGADRAEIDLARQFHAAAVAARDTG